MDGSGGGHGGLARAVRPLRPRAAAHATALLRMLRDIIEGIRHPFSIAMLLGFVLARISALRTRQRALGYNDARRRELASAQSDVHAIGKSSANGRRSLCFALAPHCVLRAGTVRLEEVSPPPVTLTQQIMHSCGGHSPALAQTLLALQRAAREVCALMRRGLRSPCTHWEESEEQSSGDVERLDLAAADIFIRALRVSAVSRISLATHEQPIVVTAERSGCYTKYPKFSEYPSDEPKYAVVIDPLDGANNADAGVSVGSIFGVYELNEASTREGTGHVLRAGKELVAAGYAMYGASTLFVMSMGHGTHGFTLDSLGEFLLTRPHIRTPLSGRTYSVNVALSGGWEAPIASYVHALAVRTTAPAKTLRYIGTMVADVHRTLLYGGLFLYPAHRGAQKGKLLLAFEAAPMAFLAVQAGASARAIPRSGSGGSGSDGSGCGRGSCGSDGGRGGGNGGGCRGGGSCGCGRGNGFRCGGGGSGGGGGGDVFGACCDLLSLVPRSPQQRTPFVLGSRDDVEHFARHLATQATRACEQRSREDASQEPKCQNATPQVGSIYSSEARDHALTKLECTDCPPLSRARSA